MDVVPQAPPPSATLEESWEYLREGMDMIMGDCYAGDSNPPIGYVHYMAMYAVAYNFCTSSRLPAGEGEVLMGVNTMDSRSVGGLLHSNINTYFEEYVMNLASSLPTEMDDLTLLRTYLKVWSNYSSRTNYVNRLHTFLNRHWVKRQNDESKKVVQLQVYGLALKAFKEIYLAKIQAYPAHRLTDAVLWIVAKGGEEELIGKVVSSFANLRSEERTDDGSTPGEDQAFANAFVEGTSAFYKTEEERVGARRCLGKREYWGGEGEVKKW